MLFGKTKLELKVGAFVFIGLAILVTFILLIGDFKTLTSAYRVNFIFNFVNGVKIGAPVRFAGVDVGEVKALKFFFSPQDKATKVKVVSLVNKAVKIPLDSTVWVNTLGLLGEKYIEIIPGVDYSKTLAVEGTLTGKDPLAMHEVTEMAKKIAGDIDESIVKIKNQEGTLGKLLYNDTIYNELSSLVTDIRKHPWKLIWKTKENK